MLINNINVFLCFVLVVSFVDYDCSSWGSYIYAAKL